MYAWGEGDAPVQQRSRRGVRNRDAKKKKVIKSILCCIIRIRFSFPNTLPHRRTVLLYYTRARSYISAQPIRLYPRIRYYNIVCIIRVVRVLFVRARAGAYTVTPIRHSTNFPDRCLLGRRNMMRNRLRRRGRSRSRRRRRRRPGARPTPLLIIKPRVPPTRLVSRNGCRAAVVSS